MAINSSLSLCLLSFIILNSFSISFCSASIIRNEVLNLKMVSTRRSSTSPKEVVPKDDRNNSPSAIKELKETIRKQAKEIESLKAKMNESAEKSSSAPTAVSHGGHGAPMGDEDPNSYVSSPFYKLAFRRVGWLAFFLCSLSLTAVIMNGFEHTLSRQIELAYFVPLLAGHGGNTGGQCVGSVLSALSTGAVSTKDGFRIIKKEALAGATVGTVLGAVVALVAHYVGGISEHVSFVVFCTLPLLSTIAGTLASSIPFLCVIVGVDPALIAAPAMTSFVDVTGLLSYFLIANKVFQWFGFEL